MKNNSIKIKKMVTHEKEIKRQEFYNSLSEEKKIIYWTMTNNLSTLLNYKEQLEEIERKGNGRLIHKISGLIGNVEKIILGDHDLELLDDDLCNLLDEEVENYRLTIKQLKKFDMPKKDKQSIWDKYLYK